MSMTPGSTFACPRHTSVKRLGPGMCPKCGEDLVERETRRETFGLFAKRLLMVGALTVVTIVVLAATAKFMR